MDYRTAAKELGKGNVQPVYLCYGQESFLINEFLSFAIEQLIEPEHRDFAVSKYDLSETPVEAVIEDAETIPFMVPRKLVIAHGAGFFSAGKDDSKVEHRLERLMEYLQSPVDYTVVLFTWNENKLDERKKIVKLMKDRGAVIPFPMMNAEELTHWVTRRAEKDQISFAEGAVQELILRSGTHLQSLSAEIEKLSLYAGKGGTITQDAVARLVSRTTEQSIFMLIEEAVQRRLEQALSILHELLKYREEPVKIVMLLARQYRLMLQIKELSGKGFSQQQIASQLGIHPYAVKITGEQARQYDERTLTEILHQLAELDYGIKSGRTDKVLGLELFLLRLAGLET
ncbi:DNA polymerase III subunit delta [Ferviditalea candida]|uniref:DNA polymerase III subunit delta n=1 Tax=Ferviditalea candida TaxID=3108399 RepID=A0ABU5ZDZ7_9BACL|nr:DNA polymerase III subunit delta [Paenibacillaceae bacterium T2]